MSSGPEATPPGQDWHGVERLQDKLYAPPASNGPTSRSLDALVPHPARRYSYWLGGKDHFAADRASGDAIAAMYPSVVTTARENRRFMQRAVTFLAGECGIRQFLDIGCGLPAADNTHEIAQRIAPTCRVVYVDNEPLVMAYARALLTGTPQGQTAYIERDLRDPAGILGDAAMGTVLDLDEPVGLLLVAVLHFLLDADQPAKAIAELLDAMPAGSYCVLSHVTGDAVDDATRACWDELAASGAHGAFQHRGRDDLLAMVEGWDLVDPGLVPVAEWRRDPSDVPPAWSDAAAYALVVKKPDRARRPPLPDGWDPDTTGNATI